MNFEMFWGLFCKTNSTLTSFGKLCMKHESNKLLSRSDLFWMKNEKKWFRKVFRENNVDIAETF